jgi:Ca2+-binding EF-hand superfamily protein
VYSPNGNGWPRLVGKLRDGVLVEQKQIRPGDLFQRLDDFLKMRQIRLQSLFDRFDSDRDGELTMSELSAMIRQQMPEVSRAELLYFQV